MRLTWFGGRTIRIHIGGTILVIDAEGVPDGIDSTELVSGADVVITEFGTTLEAVDTAGWKPRKPPRLLDEGEVPPAVQVRKAWAGAILVDAIDEPPLLLVSDQVPPLGRWAEAAVVVLFGPGERLAQLGNAVLDDTPPRLLALAGNEAAIDTAIGVLRERLESTGLVSLEAGMALEI